MQYEQNTLRRLQLAELGILKDIDRVCREHSITYWLDSGTVLGAVRHGGFIPWDDDIDIGMPRDDYERFLGVAPMALGPRYCVTNPHTCSRQAAQFAKVMLAGTRFVTDESEEAEFEQGIFVDVFPYDAVFVDSAAAKRQRRSCMLWQTISYLYHSGNIVVPHKGLLGAAERFFCRAAHVFVKFFFNPDSICSRFENAALAANNISNAGGLMVSAYASTGPFPREMLLPPSLIEFEGCFFMAPADARGYLKRVYGEKWNQLPPIDQRRNHAPKRLVFES